MPSEPCVYHAVPPQMLGETLYPLRDLKRLDPERYLLERAKYDDHPARRRIPESRVARLDCAHEEVLNFAPVHPRRIYQAWQDLGVTLKPQLWFGIPVSRLEGLPAIVTVPEVMTNVGDDLGDDAVCWLEPASYCELTELPEATLHWYKRLLSEKKRGAWFVGVPHVLVRGPVSVSGLVPIDWSLPR